MRRERFRVSLMVGGGCRVEHGKIAERPIERSVIRLPVSLARDLKSEARRRGMSPDELASALIRTVSTEQLYNAVLGEVGEAVQRRSVRRS